MSDLKTSPEERREARRKRRERHRRGRDENGRGRDAAEKSQLRQWGEALVFALIVMLIVRTLFFDLFRIPTPSMEKNLLVGDYLFVSKLHYGTRMPLTIGIPFTQIYLRGVEMPYTRLPGFTEVQRGDAVVFNYPPQERPIDRKMHYVKRVVGLPGETFEIRDKTIYANGEAYPLGPGMQQLWNVRKGDERYQFSPSRLAELGISQMSPTQNPNVIRVQATRNAAEEIRSWPWIEEVEPYIIPENVGYSASMFPPGRGYTPDNYGPIQIPRAGDTIELTEETWPVYRDVISRYEEHTVRRLEEGRFEIDGVETNEFTLQQDYYFVMGDNRDDSEDSRFWGFVPKDHIVGKAILTYFSWNAERNLPRFNRIFRVIN